MNQFIHCIVLFQDRSLDTQSILAEKQKVKQIFFFFFYRNYRQHEKQTVPLSQSNQKVAQERKRLGL